MFSKLSPISLSVIPLLWLLAASPALAQGTSFTYQGKLSDGGAPANGSYDFQFSLYDTATVTGTQLGTTQTLTGVGVSGGLFTVQLDFGACPACFNGAARFLEIAVKPTSSGTFTTLGPRQPLSSTPYAIRSLNAAAADGLSVACVNCVTGGQIASVSGSAVSGEIPVGSVPPGSASYIQNTTSQQAASNFSISGDGTLGGTLSVNAVDATTQFNLGGSRVLSATGSSNLFAGLNTGTANTGLINAFFGASSGAANSSGGLNSFFGGHAGLANTTGGDNAFFGAFAGANNTIGNGNAFFGRYAGLAHTTGSNTTILGSNAGLSNTAESDNTFVGASSNGAAGITNATAIGSRAAVSQSNSLVLGSISGVNGATADTKVGIGTTAPAFKLQVIDGSNTGLRVQTNSAGGIVASFGSSGDFQIDGPGVNGGRFIVKEDGRVGIGTTSPNPNAKLHVEGSSGTGVLGSSDDGYGVEGYSSSNTAVYGYSSTGWAGYFNGKVSVIGTLAMFTLGSAGTTTLCRNALVQIATCSSSLRYKTDVRPFAGGLEIIHRLRPIAFTWKQGGLRDLGLAAEEVAEVEPLLVTHNDKGEVEGVKYDRLNVLLINAIKEQQAQIETQQRQIAERERQAALQQTFIQRYQNQLAAQQTRIAKQGSTLARQQRELDALKHHLCHAHPKAEVCRATGRRP